MEKLIAQCNDWNYLDALPKELYGFTLSVERRQHEMQYLLFSYGNTDLNKHFLVLYDQATKEYIARCRHNLIEFCDVNFIATDLATLQSILEKRLDKVLHNMAVFDTAALGSVFLGKKIIEWPYATKLATNIQGFSLVINPTQPLKGINGSFIIVDYSDFQEKTNLLLYYNIYRDEFYGETVFRGTPQMTVLFDAKDLKELEEKLKTNLESALVALRQRLLGVR